MNKSGIAIPPDAVLWRILATEGPWSVWPSEGGEERQVPTVVLEWGWTAGLTEEELDNWADDAPKGKGTVRTTLPLAKALHRQLGELIADLERKVSDDPPPAPTPTTFDLVMLFLTEECNVRAIEGPFDIRDVIANAPVEVQEPFRRVIEASTTNPAKPGESVREWRDRLAGS